MIVHVTLEVIDGSSASDIQAELGQLIEDEQGNPAYPILDTVTLIEVNDPEAYIDHDSIARSTSEP